MNVNYFNPKDYFWFKHFTPDVKIKSVNNRLLKTTGEVVSEAEEDLFTGGIDPIFSKILNATFIYIQESNMKKIIDCLAINNSNYIFSIQIDYDFGMKQIMFRGNNYIDVQNHYNVLYFMVNEDIYINFDNFYVKFAKPVNEKYNRFYMREFEKLDPETKRKAIININYSNS